MILVFFLKFWLLRKYKLRDFFNFFSEYISVSPKIWRYFVWRRRSLQYPRGWSEVQYYSCNILEASGSSNQSHLSNLLTYTDLMTPTTLQTSQWHISRYASFSIFSCLYSRIKNISIILERSNIILPKVGER